MPDSQLSPQLIRQITDHLAPFVIREETRTALLAEAFGNDSRLLSRIDTSGDSRTFLGNLIRFLHDYGDTGSPALVALLIAAKGWVGGKKLDGLIAQVTGGGGSAHRIQIPHHRNSYFTGRVAELAELERVLTGGEAVALTQPQALTGMGGIGKTQIAVEFAYRHAEKYMHVFWIEAEKEETLRTGFVGILRQAAPHLIQQNDEPATVQAAQQWLASNKGWLLILDNADDAKQTRRYIPTSGTGQVLLTSRTRTWRNIAHRIEISKLSEEDGATLLLRCADIIAEDAPLASATLEDQEAARKFCQEVDGLALALDQAGAYIAKNRRTIAYYHDLYNRRGAELRAKQVGENPTEHATVAVTYSLALDKIKTSQPAAVQLLHYSALLAPEPIPETIFTEGAKRPDTFEEPLSSVATEELLWDETIGVLYDYSLIERPTDSVYSLHRVIQEVIKDGLGEDAQSQHAQALMTAILHADPGSDYRHWEECERLLPHWRVCIHYIETYNIESNEAARLLNQVGLYLSARGLYYETEPLLDKALKIREITLGELHPTTADSLNNLAALYYTQGKLNKAEPLYDRALKIREATQGESYSQQVGLYLTANSLSNLAALYVQQGKLDKAEPLCERALKISETTLEKSHPFIATSLNNLAALYYTQGKYDLAKPLFDKALNISETTLGKSHPFIATSLNNLAELYRLQGKFDKAEPLFDKALNISEAALGESHPDTAISINNLALLYQDQGKYDLAEPLFDKALNIRETTQGESHPQTAQSLNNLAGLYRDQGKFDKAEPLYDRALKICETTLGKEHPNTILVSENLDSLRSLRREMPGE